MFTCSDRGLSICCQLTLEQPAGSPALVNQGSELQLGQYPGFFGKLAPCLLPHCPWASGTWSAADWQLANSHALWAQGASEPASVCSSSVRFSTRRLSSSAVHYRCLHNTAARHSAYEDLFVTGLKITPSLGGTPQFSRFPHLLSALELSKWQHHLCLG